MRFKDKTVLVSGASRGIGRAVAHQFAEEGAQVAVHYHRNKKAAEITLSQLSGEGHFLVQADVADPRECERLISTVIERIGKLDIVVNNAGIFEKHRISEIDYDKWLEVWQRTIATNLMGPANIMYWAAQQMIRQGGGRIINVTSRGAFRGEPQAPAYGASKAGLNSLTQSLARALAPHNIIVTAVAPGWVDTDMAAPYLGEDEAQSIRAQSPLNRIAHPDEIARTVLFLASEGVDFVTGAIVDVNGASYLRS